jgi:type I restriction enzyme S subunit
MGVVLDEKVIELRLDRSNWQLVKFGDVAIQQKGAVDRENTKLTKYVKGEHMSSEDLHLREWGELTDEYLGPAFIRKFEEGDILYGSRRTYLRKVAVAHFSGITSNTTFVIKANEANIDKRLMPFVMLSEGFAEHSIRNSKGSVNPYVNWKDLADYEFLLPPKDQQAQLAELLWAMNEMIEKEFNLLRKLSSTLNTKIENEIHGLKLTGSTIDQVIEKLKETTEVLNLGLLGEILKGRGIAKLEVKGNGISCVRYGELYTRHYRIVRNYYSFINIGSASNSFKLEKNDVLFAGSGETISEIGKSAAFISDDIVYAGSDILIFRPHEMDGTFLGYLMNSLFVRQQLNKYGTGSTVMHIYPSDIKKIKIPFIQKDKQIEIGRKLEDITTNILTLEDKISSSKSLQKSLINQIF